MHVKSRMVGRDHIVGTLRRGCRDATRISGRAGRAAHDARRPGGPYRPGDVAGRGGPRFVCRGVATPGPAYRGVRGRRRHRSATAPAGDVRALTSLSPARPRPRPASRDARWYRRHHARRGHAGTFACARAKVGVKRRSGGWDYRRADDASPARPRHRGSLLFHLGDRRESVGFGPRFTARLSRRVALGTSHGSPSATISSPRDWRSRCTRRASTRRVR